MRQSEESEREAETEVEGIGAGAKGGVESSGRAAIENVCVREERLMLWRQRTKA